MAITVLELFLLGAISSGSGRGSQSGALPLLPPASWFPYRQGWLGGDGAYSVPVAKNRSLWLFGDTFVGPSTAKSRRQATGFIHNSIAFSSCPRPHRCRFRYYWRGMGTPNPKPVFSTGTTDWFWPLDGFVYRGTLYVALMQMHSLGAGGPFGFTYRGVQLASVRNYTAPPQRWLVTYQKLNTGSAAIPGVSIVAREGPHGNPDPANPHGASYAYFFTLVGSGTPAMHLGLLRIPLNELPHAARPGNADWEYLKSNSTWAPWPQADTALPADSAIVIKPGAPEMTVRYHSSTHQWIAVYPVGLAKAAYDALSTSLTGPWGRPEKLYEYPEMQPSNPNFTPNVFCYAAKEHIEFETPGHLLFTYVCNSTHQKEIVKNMELYHPVVVTLPLPPK